MESVRRAHQFVRILAEWQRSTEMTQRGMALRLGCAETLVSMVLTGERRPSAQFMSRAITSAPEPWKSALKQARQADLEAADAALAVA